LAYAIIDGTLIPTDRVADQKPFYSSSVSPVWTCPRAMSRHVCGGRSPLDRRGNAMRYGRFVPPRGALLQLAAWLAEQQVQLVVIEATGEYWKPVFYVLERSLTVWLVNARDIKKVPGRKTDVSDARWIAQHGLVSPSFVPPPANPDPAVARPDPSTHQPDP
jgi:hypothetical protein